MRHFIVCAIFFDEIKILDHYHIRKCCSGPKVADAVVESWDKFEVAKCGRIEVSDTNSLQFIKIDAQEQNDRLIWYTISDLCVPPVTLFEIHP